MKLVFIENNKTVTDSLTVGEVFGKEHKRVMQDIRELDCSSEFREHNFVLTSYMSTQNKELPKYIITQDGFSFLAMGYTGKEAARFKEMYIAEFNRMKEQLTINTQALSPELQMFNQMFTAVARLELGTAEQEKRLSLVEKKQDNITEVLSLNPTEWRKKTSNLLNKIAQQRGGFGAYQEVRTEAYQMLEDRAKCQLSTRLTNKKRKAALEGLAKSKIDKINKMDVIADDARLVEIFLAVVKELAIKHNVEVESA